MRQKSDAKKFSWKLTPKTTVVILIVLAVLAAYAPSLSNQFVWDDHDRIENNLRLYDFSNITGLFEKEGYFEVSAEPSYRPIVIITRFIDIALWGKWAPGHRITNLLLHLIASLLLFFLCLRLFQNLTVAGLSALLFAVHPILSEPAAAIAFRADILVGIFALVSILSFWNFRQGKRPGLMLLISLISYFFAMLSKENAVFIPAVILLFDFFYFRKTAVPSGSKLTVFKKFSINNYWGFLALFLYYLLIRFCFIHQTNEVYFGAGALLSLANLVVTPCRLFLLSLVKFFWPDRLTIWEVFERSTQFGWSEFLGVAALLLFVLITLLALRRKPLIALGLSWYIVTLLPWLQIIPMNTPFFERWMYFPVMGLIIVFGTLLLALVQHYPQRRRLIFTIIIAIIILFTIRTEIRCLDWKNDFTIWKAATIVQPNNINALINIGDYPKAIKLLKEAIKKDPSDFINNYEISRAYLFMRNYQKALNYAIIAEKIYLSGPPNSRSKPNVASFYGHLAVLYIKIGEFQKAADYCGKSLELFYFPMIQIRLASAYTGLGRYEEALSNLSIARKESPFLVEGYLQESLIYRRKGESQAALRILLKAHDKFPDNPIVLAELVDALIATGDLETARSLAGEPLKNNVDQLLQWGLQYPAPPVHPSTAEKEWLARSHDYRSKGQFIKAIKFLESKRVSSKWDKIYLELGTVYVLNKQFDKAVESWLTALRLNPKNPDIYFNLGMYSAIAHDYSTAYKLWNRSLELNPNQPDLRQNIAALPEE